MTVNKFQTLLLNMMLLVMQKKYRLDEILIISRQMKDRIALFDCGKVQGATLDTERKRCTCENAGSILSDERGKLKCYGKVDKPNCRMEIISNTSHTNHTIDFEKECPRRTVLNSAVWNTNTTGEARGYWLHSDDIKAFLHFDTEGNLKVNVSKGLLDGLFLKLELLCSSTNMIKCVLIKIHGARLYPLTQFNTSTIVPTPTTTAATETTVTTRAAAANDTVFATVKTISIMTTARTKAVTAATTGRRLAKAKKTVSPILKPKSTATPTSRSEMNTKQAISKNSINTQRNKSVKQKSSSKNHIAIIVLLVASVTMLISSILLVYLWRQRKRKLNLREDRLKRPSQQPLESINLQPAFSKAKRNSTKSNIYETFGVEYTSVTIATSLKPGEQKALYNELPHDHQEVKSVYTDLSNINPTCLGKLSHDKPEEREKKVFRSHLNIPREKASATPKLEEGKRQYKELVASYLGAKPVYTDISKDNPTFEEEHLYKELEEPKRSEIPPASNVANKQGSVAFNPPNKSDKQIPQYSEIAPRYPDSLPLYANPNAVGGHVYRELEEPNKTDSPFSPNVIYDKPQCVVENYCHRVRKLSSEVLNPKLIQARVLSDGIVV